MTDRREIWIMTVSSMEQIIGAALSTVVGVMLPLIHLLWHPGLSGFMQGLVGAIGLIGIACGSPLIGKLADKQGYLKWFRICPALIIVGCVICFFCPTLIGLLVGLFVAGMGVGGGYSLDSAYISELMPNRVRFMMVGAAKATCAIGFILAAFVGWLMLRGHGVSPHIWPWTIWIVGIMAVVTLLLRIRWWESPKWLLAHGQDDRAQACAQRFFGTAAPAMLQQLRADLAQAAKDHVKPTAWADMFRGDNLRKVIYSGIPWACEGLGVYGFGVFLPVLVGALGLADSADVGVVKVSHSVLITTIVNFFILPGFIIGLLLVNRMNHRKMLVWGFVVCAGGLVLLLAAFLLHWPIWASIVGFMVFEIFLNAGPHLITYIIPPAIYNIQDLGAGAGIATMLGKVGAIAGVMLMPLLLHSGGMTMVLIVSTAVMILGAVVAAIFGKPYRQA